MIKATQRAFETVKSFETIHTLLMFKNWDFSVSEDLVKELVSFGYDDFNSTNIETISRLLLAHFESAMPITEEIRLYTAHSHPYPGDIIRLFLDERRPLDLQSFWERLWQTFCDSSEEVSDVLLEYTTLEISKRTLERVPSPGSKPLISSPGSSRDQDSSDDQESSDSDYSSDLQSISYLESTSDLESISDLEARSWTDVPYEALSIRYDFLSRLVWFLVEHNFAIPQDVMGVIMEKGLLATIVAVLDHNPYISITDELLNAAGNNPDYYDISWLLYMFSESMEVVGAPDGDIHIIHWPRDSRECNLSSCTIPHSVAEHKDGWHTSWKYSQLRY
ncbi:uncharacterized protein N7483_003443 [Penicillium malachiteum]|uniref:uncharacterized protein n=1 Tax=Penicillium malachiteum TaxID=1324776 RepID=UPI0025470F9A|nr:uncharacterized protein N7483_003443 [Penicillium malachiteum]KAJ5728935.1 hypothetical protein N7483_003443 [Penicillium malachiteum]